MANTLMFEVGIKQAVDGLDKVKKELDQFITDYSKKMQIQVDIKNLETFINALKSIGNGEQLKPLLNQIERLQNRLGAMTDKGQYFDMIRGEAEAAAAAVKIAEKNLENIKRTGNVNLISNARNNLEQAQQEAARTAAVLANATERFAKEEARASAATNDTKQKIDALGQSVAELHTKIGSGININLSGDFSKWAQEVQIVTASVRELVEQLQKMNTATTTAAKGGTDALLAQAKVVEDLRKQLVGMTFSYGGMLIPKEGLNSEALNIQNKLNAEQQKFDEMLARGASVAGSYAEAIQQLGQKYNFTADQAQKLAVIIANGNPERGNIQRVLGIGYERAGDIIETINALQKLKQEEGKPAPQGGLFDAQQFNTLREAIDQVIKEINRLKEAFAGIGEFKGVTQLTEAINTLYHNVSTFKDVFATLSAAVNLSPTSDYVRRLQTDFEAAQSKVQELTEKLTALAAAQNNVAESASKVGKSEQQIGDSQSAMFNRYNKLLADIQNIEKEALNLRNTLGGSNPLADGLRDYIISLGRIRSEVKSIASSENPAEAITKGMSVEKLSRLNSALAVLKTNFKDTVSEAKAFNKATDKGSSQAEARIRKLGMAFNELKNYMKANGGSEEMRRLQVEIQGAIRKMRDLMNAGRYGEAVNVYERLSGIIRQAATATKDFERAQHSASSTVSHTNTQLIGQSQILSDLKTMAMQYLSVWGASTFIHNIIELGGQLEQQRLSIGAILQDTAQANHLFGQIKDLAIKSPFGVQQLDAMSKQLSAYGFQYSELYEWTKRLADISAATGTSVDRLALALGHVRSEGALSGYTLRQFSMGNIPLLQKLSENLGKTKQEIRKMTRNKEIGYEDVLNVLKQLTDEGGMFFEAQETMANALNAKFKNLRDSFQIMYSEMAEGAPGDFLKKVAETLTDISKAWRVLMPLVIAGGTAFGAWKLAMMAFNYEAEKSGRLMTMNALATSKYSVSQLRAIATTGRFTLALKGLGRALMNIGRFIFNPVTLGFATVEGLIYLWSKHNDEVRRAKELSEQYKETAKESQKNIGNQLENIPAYNGKMTDSEMKTGIESMTEAIKNYGVNGQKVINDMINSSMSLAEKYQYLREELEKTAKVYKEMERTSGAFEYGINQSDGGWFDENVETNLTDYAKSFNDFVDDVTTYNSQYGNSIEKAIKNAENSDLVFREATKNMTSYGEKLAEFWSNPEKYQNAAKFMNSLFGSGADSQDALDLNESFFGYLKDKNRALKDLDEFFDATESKLKEKGYVFTEQGKHLTETQVGNLLKQSKDWLEKHPEWENIYSVIWDKLNQRWGLPIEPDVTPVEEKLPEWMQAIQDELKGTGIQIKIGMSQEQIIEEARKAYQSAETTINKLGPIAIKAGVKIEGLTDEVIAKYGPTSENYDPELYNTLLELKSNGLDKKNAADAYGKKRGINFAGMKKDGSHKAEKQNQENAKAVREQVRVIKAAADAFQYWRDKVGDKGAWEHVQSEFGDVLAKIGITAQNIEDVRGHLKKIPEMKEYKAITDKKVKTEIKKEIANDEDQFIRKDFERDTERFLSKTQIELDNLTRSWETFNAVREATNDIQLAANLSGAEYAAGQMSNLAAALKEKIQNDLYSIKDGLTIDFNINLSDEQVQREVERVFEEAKPVQEKGESKEDYNKRLTEYQSKIKGVVNEIKKWRDLQRQMRDESIKAYASMVADTDSLKIKVAKVNDEYQKQIEYLNTLRQLGKLTDEQYKNGIENAGRTRKLGQAEALVVSTDWGRSFGVVGSVLKGAARELGSELKKIITSSDFRKLDAAEQTKYLELQSKLHQGGQTVTSPFNLGAWGDMQNLSRDFQKNVKSLIESMKDLDYWTREEADAEKAFNSASSPLERAAALTRLTVARQNKNNAQVKVKEDESNVKETGEQLQQAGEDASNGLNDFSQALSQVTNGSLSGLVLGIGNIIKVLKGDGEQAKSVGGLFGEAGKKIGGLIEAVLSIIDMLGEEPVKFFDDLLSKVSRMIEAVISNIPNILGSILKGAGNIVASAVDGIGGLFGIDFGLSGLFNPDGKLQEEIDALKANVAALEANTEVIKAMRERTLGYDTGEKRQQIKDLYGFYAPDKVESRSFWDRILNYNPAKESMYKLYGENDLGNGYSQELENLKKTRQDYLEMYNAEQDKKDSSAEALEEYKKKIAELDEEIIYFTQDLAKELWSIDIKGWADQIGDALWTAFENGEDAMKAFHNTAKDIVADVAKRMMNLGVIEPLFKKLEKALFGTWSDETLSYTGGAIKYDKDGNIDMQGSQNDVLRLLGQYFGEGGLLENSVSAAQQFYDMVKQITGIDFSSGSSTSSKVIQGGFSEEETGLVLSYMNGMRADVALNKGMIAEYFPMFYQAMTSGNAQLVSINQHVAEIERSNQVISERVDDIRNDFHGLRNGTWKIPVS